MERRVGARMTLAALALAGALCASTLPPAPAQTGAAEARARLRAANALYLDSDFEGAARVYEALAAEGWDGPDLHLNLGNARLRQGRRGLAIASYERALRLDPWDADARANLEAARAGNVDRVLGRAERSLLERLVQRTPERLATGAFALAWIALWTALALRRRASGRERAALAAVAVAAALATVVAGALLAGKVLERRTPVAVVVVPSSPAREGPSRTLRAAFQLHEGTLVRLLEARDDLVRVRLENGLEGWVAAETLERI